MELIVEKQNGLNIKNYVFGISGWPSQLSVQLLISAQVMTSQFGLWD